MFLSQMGSGVVRGGSGVRFHESSTWVACCWGCHLSVCVCGLGSPAKISGFSSKPSNKGMACMCLFGFRVSDRLGSGVRFPESSTWVACCWGCHLSVCFCGLGSPAKISAVPSNHPTKGWVACFYLVVGSQIGSGVVLGRVWGKVPRKFHLSVCFPWEVWNPGMRVPSLILIRGSYLRESPSLFRATPPLRNQPDSTVI